MTNNEALDIELFRMHAQTISPLTASLRFDGALSVSVTEFQTNLVPYFVHSQFALQGRTVKAEKAYLVPLSVAEITMSALQPASVTVK